MVADSEFMKLSFSASLHPGGLAYGIRGLDGVRWQHDAVPGNPVNELRVDGDCGLVLGVFRQLLFDPGVIFRGVAEFYVLGDLLLNQVVKGPGPQDPQLTGIYGAVGVFF